MNLNANQLAFLIDGVNFFDTFDDYWSYDGKYHLTIDEIEELRVMLLQERNRLGVK